jgi:Zn-dependent protease
MLTALFESFDIVNLLVYGVVLLTAFPIHEYAHGWMAYKLGDDTAYYQGRLSLNPLRHLDLIGTICMLLCGFGWAKPVPVNPVRFNRKVSMKTGMALVALAGPLSNIIIGFIAYVLYKILFYSSFMAESEYLMFLANVFSIMCSVNLGLAAFNLLPVPPLDGSRIFFSIVPERFYWKIMRYEQYIRIGLLALIFFGSSLLYRPLGAIEGAIYNAFDFITRFIDIIFENLL